MGKIRSPYLTEDWYDPHTHEYYCPECHDVLERRGEVVKDHVLGVWKHYGYVTYPGVKATDAQGRTIERQWYQPPRIMKVLIPMQANLRFCVGCFPFSPEELSHELCVLCSDGIADEHEHTAVEFLWKHTNGYNGPLLKGMLHTDCLPEHFEDLRAYRAHQKMMAQRYAKNAESNST